MSQKKNDIKKPKENKRSLETEDLKNVIFKSFKSVKAKL